MHRLQALGVVVLLVLAAPRVSAAQAKGTAEQEKEKAQEAERQAEAWRQQAEAMRKQAEAAQEEARKKEAERDAAEKQAQAAKEEEEKQQEKKPSGPEPELNLPIRYYIYTAVLSGLGYGTSFLSAKPERDLRDPAKHPTSDKTLSLYRRAYYGGLLSKGFYSLSGTMGAYAAYKTQSAIRQYLTAKAQMAARQQQADRRLDKAGKHADPKASEVTNALLAPPGLLSTEIPVAVPEPPPIQAGVFVGPSGDASLSLSVRF